MTLSRLLSKPQATDYQQVDTFWFPDESEENEDYECGNENDGELPILIGQHIFLDTGSISLNYYCTDCENVRTFSSGKEHGLRGVVVSQRVISIDCVLQCNCGSVVHTWFLVESEQDFRNQSPGVRILHFRDKLSGNVKLQSEQYGEFAEWLEKANQAHRDGLGSGAVIYLRKVFESITYNIAKVNDIQTTRHRSGRVEKRDFYGVLKDVDEKHSIIPNAFSGNGYKLFSELSSIIHGDGSEDDALKNFGALYTLVTGIIDNIKQKEELKSALQKFDWSMD
ncbi:MAG: hypothetical protein FWC16_13950 [Defluviitaleaceae bacterium]|nr:hypothetical protein [Defluviitaleaceae bacterium]MCL2276015.1 hypothetical protein [Defluviitaleaceae bacterium]